MWIMSQSNGRVYRTDGTHAATGYSGGGGGSHPEAVNNHSMQDRKGIGPTPVGFYLFGDPVNDSHLGPLAIPLIPLDSNQMFGRVGMYWHGDNEKMNHSASDGCGIMPRAIREEVIASGDKQLAVIYIRNGEE